MCLPKSNTGLGIRPTAVFNNAAMAKLAWKIISEPENWWVKLVKLKYLRTTNFFSTSKKNNHSLAWKGILDARPLILEGMQWLVGNGSSINLWTFNWCYPFPLFKFVPHSQKHLLNLSQTVDTIISNNNWNPDAIAPFLPHDVITHISSLPLPIEARNDEFIWALQVMGIFY